MELAKGFVYLHDVDASIIQDLKYYTRDNFIGRRIKGYEAPVCILTKEAAEALAVVQKKLLTQSLSLIVFDAYRPKMAVNDFIDWSRDANDNKMKKEFYPNINKADFLKLGYLVEKSAHTRGSTVDLSIVRLSSNHVVGELDMATHFDFMDELSHYLSPNINDNARHHRLLLRSVMQEGGFVPYDKEWWHFTLKNEVFPDTYYNFPVS